jgi:hypothetical protein
MSISLFSTFLEHGSDPLGTSIDICVALGGILSGGLAWKLYPTHHSHAPRESRLALGFALAGACFVLIGASLAIFHGTEWFLAWLVTTFGYAMIGLWLVGLNYSAVNWSAFPRTLAQYGLITGWVMTMGIFAAPGILADVNTTQAAPWFVLLALFVGTLGWNVLYMIWCIGLGYLLLVNS